MSIPDRRHRWLLAAAVLAGALLRLGTLDATGFWLDEQTTARVTRFTLRELVANRLAAGHPPLFFLLEWVVARLFGESEVVLRLPAALAGTAAIPLLHALVARTAPRSVDARRAALLAAALLAVSPAALHLSQVARMYSLVALLGLAASWLLVRAEQAPAPEERLLSGLTLLYAAVAVTALYTHFSAYLVVLTHLGYLLARRRPRWRLAAGSALALAAALPWLLVVRWAMARLPQRTVWTPLEWTPPLGEWAFAHLLQQLFVDTIPWGAPPWLVALKWLFVALALGLAIRGGAAVARSGRTGGAMLPWLVLGPLAVGLAVAAVGPNLLHVQRYHATTGAALMGLVGLGIASLRVPAGVRRAVAAGVVAGSLGGWGLGFAYPHHIDFRAIAEVLRERRQPGEEVLALLGEEFRYTTFDYYYPDGYQRLGARPRRTDVPPGAWLVLSPRVLDELRQTNPRLAGRAHRELHRLERRLPRREAVPLRSGELIHLAPASPPGAPPAASPAPERGPPPAGPGAAPPP